MSTLAYAQLTTKRDEAQKGTSDATSPGVQKYVDALAALVPAEVLSLHALIISVTTQKNQQGAIEIPPENTATLFWSFWGLIVFAILLYAVWRWLANKWDEWDWLRVLIPPLAFTGWTMLQRMTAFDAVYSSLGQAPRTVIALFLAVVLGGAAAALAYKADQTPAH